MKIIMDLQVIQKEASFLTILFVALAPDEADRNGDIISEEEITKTAHEFMINLQDKKVDIDHDNDDVVEDAIFVESYVAPAEITLDNDAVIPKWCWIVWIKFSQDVYDKFVDGDYVWISIDGEWYRLDV